MSQFHLLEEISQNHYVQNTFLTLVEITVFFNAPAVGDICFVSFTEVLTSSLELFVLLVSFNVLLGVMVIKEFVKSTN